MVATFSQVMETLEEIWGLHNETEEAVASSGTGKTVSVRKIPASYLLLFKISQPQQRTGGGMKHADDIRRQLRRTGGGKWGRVSPRPDNDVDNGRYDLGAGVEEGGDDDTVVGADAADVGAAGVDAPGVENTTLADVDGDSSFKIERELDLSAIDEEDRFRGEKGDGQFAAEGTDDDDDDDVDDDDEFTIDPRDSSRMPSLLSF